MNANNVEGDWSKVKLRDDVDWVDAVSANGKRFKIGSRKTDAATTPDSKQQSDDETVQAMDKTPFDIKVDWPAEKPPPEFDFLHYATAEETRVTSITRYFVGIVGLSLYEIEFCCTEPYHFYFYDKTGDCYGNNVIWPRPETIHYIDYFSSDGDIVRVTGS